MDVETKSEPVLSLESELAGAWRVERVLEAAQGLESALCSDATGSRAICTPLSPLLGAVPLDDQQVQHWGSLRRVLPDLTHGRVVVDEIPEGPLLSEILEEGRRLPQGALEEITARVKEAHRLGFVHGSLTPDRIVVAPEGLVIAGWALTQQEEGAARAKDSAALAALQALQAREAALPASDPEEDASSPTGPAIAAPSSAALHAAIASDHIPTLRGALAAWAGEGGSPEHPDARRAADALGRLESRAAEHVAQARTLLAQGDTLGVVAACREAIRIGEQDEAEALIADARKNTRRQLSGKKLPTPRVLAVSAIAALALVLLVIAGLLSLRSDPEDEALQRRVARIAEQQGPRESVRHLVALHEGGDERALVGELLGASLIELAASERTRLMGVRDRVVSEGARPRDADLVAEEGLAELDSLAATGTAEPALGVRVANALAEIDRAASLYRAGSRVEVRDAESAVEELLAMDPLFVEAGQEGVTP